MNIIDTQNEEEEDFEIEKTNNNEEPFVKILGTDWFEDFYPNKYCSVGDQEIDLCDTILSTSDEDTCDFNSNVEPMEVSS